MSAAKGPPRPRLRRGEQLLRDSPLLGLARQLTNGAGFGDQDAVGRLEPPAVQSSPYRARLPGAAVRLCRTFGADERGREEEEKKEGLKATEEFRRTHYEQTQPQNQTLAIPTGSQGIPGFPTQRAPPAHSALGARAQVPRHRIIVAPVARVGVGDSGTGGKIRVRQGSAVQGIAKDV